MCKECNRSFHNAYAKATHTCVVVTEVPRVLTPYIPPIYGPIPDSWHIITDGSGGGGVGEGAGWGVAVYSNDTTTPPTVTLYGPVMLDRTDQRSLGAERNSNNTAELSAIAEALIWLNEEAPGRETIPAIIFYGSTYAAEATQGNTDGPSNKEMINQLLVCYCARITWVIWN